MPIRLLLEHDHLFDPEEIDSLILAFENTLRVLGPVARRRLAGARTRSSPLQVYRS
jgi:hypothetical protein